MKLLSHKETLELRARRAERGASLVEYLIAVAMVGLISIVGQNLLVDALKQRVEKIAHTLGGGTTTVINGGVDCFAPVPGMECLSPNQNPEFYVPHESGRPNGGDLDENLPPGQHRNP